MPTDDALKPRGKKFSWKKLWKKFRSNKKTLTVPGAIDRVEEDLPRCSVVPERRETSETGPITVSDGFNMDIHEVDKDRIRTSGKEGLDNTHVFPSREEVKEKIENAHKYYGVKCMYNYYSEDDQDNKELQPSWYYILERPLVEQYVLMTNYIRKLSVMASLKSELSGVAEEPAIEDDVSSISSCSDYADFAPDSKIAAKLRETKKLGVGPSLAGVSRLEKELRELKYGTRSEERTIKTNEYTIVIRESAKEHGNVGEVSSSSFNGGELAKIERIEQRTDEKELPGSGDHLLNMTDFDLSSNLVLGPVESRNRGFRQGSFYHWLGNSTPTKTPLLNMDCQPPVRLRAPGTARDFLSFRNLSLSSEFVDSCRDFSVAFAEECRSKYLTEITVPDDPDVDQVSSATQTIPRNPVLSLTWKDTQMNYSSALTESSTADWTEQSDIIERAALASDYIRECNALGGMGGEDPSTIDGISFPENAPSGEDVLATSASQMDARSDSTESESASSLETQIPARSINLN